MESNFIPDTLYCYDCQKPFPFMEGILADGFYYCQDCHSKEPDLPTPKALIPGIGPDAPAITNSKGGKQSSSPYDFTQVHPIYLFELSKLLKNGGKKYGKWNWMKIPTHEHLNHALIHIYGFLAGDTSEKHLIHAACRLYFAVVTNFLTQKEEPNDYPPMQFM